MFNFPEQKKTDFRVKTWGRDKRHVTPPHFKTWWIHTPTPWIYALDNNIPLLLIETDLIIKRT